MLNKNNVSVHRAPHLRRSRAFEVRIVRRHARRLASTAPCKRLQSSGLYDIGHFNPRERIQNNTPTTILKKGAALLFCVGVAVILSSCSFKREVAFSGPTMGTTYHIKVVAGYLTSVSGLHDKIKARLGQINKSMSTFDPESEISRFNAISDPAESFKPSDDFLHVMKVSQKLHTLTDGAWDGTLDPLVTLWGFGRGKKQVQPPEEEKIKAALDHVGFGRLIHIDDNGLFKKNDPMVTVDLGAIAKGYGVDQIAKLIKESGIDDFLVEIGGEVYAAGRRKDKKNWQVGINRPKKGASAADVYKVVSLTDKAMATSGDYRNFFKAGGKTYSHILDPRTGYPVSNGVVSVSVVAANCTVADGLATALMVMGHQAGIDLVNRLDTVECMIIVHKKDGSLEAFSSKGLVLQ